MHKYLFLSAMLVLAAGLGFVSFSVQATPVDLSGCGGLASCTSGGVTFTGWQNNTGLFTDWMSANLTYKADSGNETGLGVACAVGAGPKCSQDEINDTPQQLIAVDLSGINFTNLALTVDSVDCNGSQNCSAPEIAYIYAATCADVSSCGGPALLGSYTGQNYPNNTYTFNFTSSDLGGDNFLWVTPVAPNDFASVNDANFLLANLSYTNVPEPAVLGMFGLGLLLIGLFVGFRRQHIY